MKKALIFILLCVVTLCCVYAEKANLVIQVTPYSLQNVAATSGRFTSTYGFGAKAGLRYNVWKNLTAGVDADLTIYKYKELESDYNVIGVRAVAGYAYDISSIFYAEAELGLGVDFRQIASAGMLYFGMDGYLGGGLRISREFALNCGVDLGLSFQTGKKTNSTDFSVKTRVGLQASL